MKFITAIYRATAVLGFLIGTLVFPHVAYASDINHPLHSDMSQNRDASELTKELASDLSTEVKTKAKADSILAEQAMPTGEPSIGAATPSAKTSLGTLSAAQQANAQRAASALAQRTPSTSHTVQTTDAAAEVQPYIFVNSSTATSRKGGDGLTINIALPQELLMPDELGNPQNITINLSFPDSQ